MSLQLLARGLAQIAGVEPNSIARLANLLVDGNELRCRLAGGFRGGIFGPHRGIRHFARGGLDRRIRGKDVRLPRWPPQRRRL